jgi:sulfite dehydrogenase
MPRRLVPAWFTFVATAVATMASAAAQRTFTLPPETVLYKESSLPGYQLVQRHCIGCHSAHYVQTQPSTLNRTYWENTVKRMKKPFGAPFPDEDIAAMVDYLVKTYGAEQSAKPGK